MISEMFLQIISLVLVLNIVLAIPAQNLRYNSDERPNFKRPYDQLSSGSMHLTRRLDAPIHKFNGQGQFDDVSYHELESNKNEVGKQKRQVFVGHRGKRFAQEIQRVFEDGIATSSNFFQEMGSKINTSIIQESIDKFKNLATGVFGGMMQAGSAAGNTMTGAAEDMIKIATGNRRKREIRVKNNPVKHLQSNFISLPVAKCRRNGGSSTTEDPLDELFRRKRAADDVDKDNAPQNIANLHKNKKPDMDIQRAIMLNSFAKSGLNGQSPERQIYTANSLEDKISRHKRDETQGQINELEDLEGSGGESGGFFNKLATTFINIFKQFLKWLNE